MPHYPDLPDSGQQPSCSAALRHVGWLDRLHPFPTGRVDVAVYERLQALFRDPWQPVVSVGRHDCELCLYRPEASGTANLYIPGDRCIFFCPELITHYMNAHRYKPPPEFCAAVATCPPPGTAAYFKALKEAGGAFLLRVNRVSP